MNKQNLIPITVETAKEMGRKAGIASGEARRKKKAIREFINEWLETEVSPDEVSSYFPENIPVDLVSNSAVIAYRLVSMAKKGDIKSIRLLLETTGDITRNKVNVVNNIDMEYQKAYDDGFKAGTESIISQLSEEELRRMAGYLDEETNENRE